jgi:hypothetical protein
MTSGLREIPKLKQQIPGKTQTAKKTKSKRGFRGRAMKGSVLLLG